MGLGMLGAATVAPLVALSIPETCSAMEQVSVGISTETDKKPISTIVEPSASRLAAIDAEIDEARSELAWRVSHWRFCLYLGDLANQITPERAAQSVVDLPRVLRSHPVMSEDSEATEFMASMITYLYGRRAQGLPAWEPNALAALTTVMSVAEQALGEYAA